MPNLKSNFEIIQMNPKNTNSVLVWAGSDCVVFDAWGNADDWIKLIDERGLNLCAIYSTHGHPDHISAAPKLAKHYDCPWYLNPLDRNLVGWGNEILDFFGIEHLCPHHDVPSDLVYGDIEILPNIKMSVLSAPGHSQGGVMFWFPDYKILLTGDTIFHDGFGRYDLPGGDKGALEKSISDLYDMNLPDDTYVVHGHGVDSLIGKLKTENPVFKHYD